MSDHDEFVFHGQRTVRGSATGVTLPQAEASGPGAATAALALLRRLEEHGGRRRVMMGAIPFDPRRPAHLIVPDRVVVEDRPLHPSPVPSPAISAPDDVDYRSAVSAALRAIEVGLVRKVVLARAVDVEADDPIDTDMLFSAFAAQNPDAYAFHIPLGDGGVLVGASPELLAAVEGGHLRSLPLAGTATRSADPDHDAASRAALTASAKDQDEHAILVAALVEALTPITSELHVPTEPEIVATPQLWHLGTPVRGTLEPGRNVLDVAYALHPTPAVGGVPAAAAADLIRILERDDREWYAGLVGWMDSSGDGEWVIALRCTRVEGSRARLFAGAGIVEGSSPDSEHAETGAKLGSAMRALGAVADVRLRVAAVTA